MNTDGNGSLHVELTRKVIGVFFEVYNELGFGFVEGVYESAMVAAFEDAGVRFERQRPIQIWFRGRVVGECRPDLLVEDRLIVELKAAQALVPANDAQVLNQLRSTDIEVALLMNFGPKAEFKRFQFDNHRKASRSANPS